MASVAVIMADPKQSEERLKRESVALREEIDKGSMCDEMEALIAAERKGRQIVLDCADLRSVDGEAVRFLEKWEADSIKLKNCGLYIREWIRRERLERESDQSSHK